jgi:CheY-like chemotaxis protein
MDVKKKVLVADDDREISDIIRNALEGSGYQVFVANDGNEALELAKLHKPDVAILDILMPGLDGVRVASYIKLDTETRNTAVVLLTGYIDKENEKQVRDSLRGVLFLSKPFTIQELIDIVGNALKPS